MRVSHLSHASPPPRVRAAEPPHPPPAPRQPSEPPGDTVPPDHQEHVSPPRLVMAVGRCKLPAAARLGLPVHEGIAPLTREPTTACPRCRATAPAPAPRQPSEPPGTPFPRPPRACLAATLGDGCGAVQATTQRAAGASSARGYRTSHASPPPRVRAAEPPHPRPRPPVSPPSPRVTPFPLTTKSMSRRHAW